jgi:hypothetical protein
MGGTGAKGSGVFSGRRPRGIGIFKRPSRRPENSRPPRFDSQGYLDLTRESSRASTRVTAAAGPRKKNGKRTNWPSFERDLPSIGPVRCRSRNQVAAQPPQNRAERSVCEASPPLYRVFPAWRVRRPARMAATAVRRFGLARPLSIPILRSNLPRKSPVSCSTHFLETWRWIDPWWTACRLLQFNARAATVCPPRDRTPPAGLR